MSLSIAYLERFKKLLSHEIERESEGLSVLDQSEPSLLFSETPPLSPDNFPQLDTSIAPLNKLCEYQEVNSVDLKTNIGSEANKNAELDVDNETLESLIANLKQKTGNVDS